MRRVRRRLAFRVGGDVGGDDEAPALRPREDGTAREAERHQGGGDVDEEGAPRRASQGRQLVEGRLGEGDCGDGAEREEDVDPTFAAARAAYAWSVRAVESGAGRRAHLPAEARIAELFRECEAKGALQQRELEEDRQEEAAPERDMEGWRRVGGESASCCRESGRWGGCILALLLTHSRGGREPRTGRSRQAGRQQRSC